MDDLCHTLPFAFKRVLSIAVMARLTIPSETNRYPIVDILHFTSAVDMVFSLLSNVCLLHGMDTRPHASANLRLYWQSNSRNVCNVLLESILNHILRIKHLRITVGGGEYTYGLPRSLGILGHGMQPIRYRMLKGLIPLIYREIFSGTVIFKIIFQELDLSCYENMLKE